MNKNMKQGIFGLSLVIPSFLLLCFVVIAPIILAIHESFRDENYTLQYLCLFCALLWDIFTSKR
ncbi:ABC-type sugar transport system permease subunit [Paenibacillus sp. V4I7]|nr:ABC-type sugar transport system permease subunit [Paenibacillus sp. V4I7]